MQTLATIRHGARDRIPQQNTDKAQEQEIPQIAQKICGENFVTGMAKLSAGKIWHEFLNTMAKFGTMLLCQISPFQISRVPKFPPSGTPISATWWCFVCSACDGVPHVRNPFEKFATPEMQWRPKLIMHYIYKRLLSPFTA